MKTPLLTITALGLALLVSGSVRGDDKPTGDLARLQGKWTTRNHDDNIHLVIEGKTIAATFDNDNGRPLTLRGEITVNQDAKPNATIDFRGIKRPNGEEIEPILGIYAFENDETVKLCASEPGQDRPKEFKAEEGSTNLVVLKREATAKPKLEGDLAKLQGKWTAKVGPEKNIDVVITVDGKSATAKATLADGNQFEVKGEIALNESAKPHKTIDWKNFKGPEGNDIADNPGIYVIEDANTVKICNGGPGKERPTEFKGAEEGDPILITLKREAAKPAEKSPEIKGDLAKLQGDWTAKVGPEKNIELTATFKGSKVTISFTTPEGQERSMTGEVVLDESAKPHKAITFKNFSRPDGTDAPENLGIYAIEGDTVKVCTGGPGNDRPTEFKAGDGGPPQLVELKRKK